MVKTERAMTRFRCGHCATRLVVQNRHLDRLVACHACGRATHPVAQRLAGAQAGGAHPGGAPAPAAVSARKLAARSTSAKAGRGEPACANCGETIGKLQARRLWHDDTVCQPCFTKLDSEAAVALRGVRPSSRAESTRFAPADAGRTTVLTPGQALPVPAGGPPVAPIVTSPGRVATASAPKTVGADVPPLELSVAPLAPVVLVGAACAGFFFALSVMSYLGGFVSALVLVTVAAMGVRWLRRGTSSVRARFEQISEVRQRHGTPRVVAMLLAWFRAQPPARLPYALFLLLFWGAMYVPYRLSSLLQSPRPGDAAVRVSA